MIRNLLIEQVDSAVRSHFANNENDPSEEELRGMYEIIYDSFASIPAYTEFDIDRDAAINSLVEQYASELIITKRTGFAFFDEKTMPWLGEEEDNIEQSNGWFYWNRYKNFLLREKHWPKNTVRSISRDTWSVLDLMANPKAPQGFERRGLVVASVQSGKTANYTGLICRAADAGYKIIIVMAGVHNVLRNQTQARLEEGFVGRTIFSDNKTEAVGVGKENLSRLPKLCTSQEADFNKNRANALFQFQTSDTNEPWLFVIKKNSNALKQVFEWLRANARQDDPLLLIDDEADNASINSKYKRDHPEADPTRINGQIRNILNLFNKKCYVGYTATPFANILIDPAVDTDEFGKDLFPSNFIYTLEESSDYFGASKVFADYDEVNPKHLRFIEDIDLYLPPKHKSSTAVEGIPESLKEAIRTFILATTLRSLDGHGEDHSTMMINVSPYKSPQKQVAGEVEDYLTFLTHSIKAFSSLPTKEALSYSDELKLLWGTWTSEYKHLSPHSWDVIQKELYSTIHSIRVVSINSDSTERLEYELHTEHVIAVGGYRLSRGLTLEGLVVSYYSRNAKAYDALMQMARWFGYRPGYEDLCRVWMSEQAAGWYKFVADATSDLFDELRNMRQVLRTPKDYGLRIRRSPDSLIITARNKMGTGQRVSAPIDLNSGFTETIAFDRDRSIIEANKKAVEELLRAASEYSTKSKNLYQYVPVEHIERFLEIYKNEDSASAKSQSRPVLNYISDRKIDGELEEWDVYIAEGDGNTVDLGGGVLAKQEIRYPGSSTSKECLVVGEKHRLASRGVEKHGLTTAEIELAEDRFYREHDEEQSVSDRYYREERSRPLLVIHPVSLKYTKSQQKSRQEKTGIMEPPVSSWPSWEHEEEAYGWSISFPYTEKQTKPVEYIFNQVAIDHIAEDYEEDSDDNDEDF